MKSKILITLFTAVVMFTSCTKQVLDINTNPNAPTAATLTANVIIPGALATSAAYYNRPTSGYQYFSIIGIWMGHFTFSGNYAISVNDLSYNITNSYDNGMFNNLYIQNSNYALAESNAKASGNQFLQGIAKLMKAYNYETLVDVFNNIPYSQALQGTSNSKPVYDDAKTVYTALNSQMDSAIVLLKVAVNSSATLPSSVDVMFGGDPTKWLALANTMKLRLLLQQSEKADRQSYITTEVAKISAGPFLTVDAKSNPGYTAASYSLWNPFYAQNYNTAGSFVQDFYVAAQYPIDFLTNTNDSRLASFYNPVSGTTYKGNAFGAQGLPNSKISSIGHGNSYSVLKGNTQSAVFMLAAESYFIQAEAALKGWLTSDPKTLYQKGVAASYAYFGLTAASATTYYTQANNKSTNWDACVSNAEKLALIIRQKWVAEIFINELIPYNDYRRLHLPADMPLSQSSYAAGKTIPNRFLYPINEVNTNSANVPTAAATDKIWWMN